MAIQLEKAITTCDGVISSLGEIPEQHPVYGTEAYPVRIRFDLTKEQRDMLAELHMRSDLEEIHRSTRSSVDQLGLFGAHRNSTTLNVQQTFAEMDTLITCVDQQQGNHIFDALRAVWKTGRAQYARLLLTPNESKVGERELPILQEHEIWYDHRMLPQQMLEALWLGAPGRETIFPAKRLRPMPTEVQPGQFLLAEMNGMEDTCESQNNLWVLKRKVRRNERSNKTSIRHGDACGFDPKRSTGRRQGEFVNIGNEPECTEDLMMIAEEFTIDYDKSHTAQMKGA